MVFSITSLSLLFNGNMSNFLKYLILFLYILYLSAEELSVLWSSLFSSFITSLFLNSMQRFPFLPLFLSLSPHFSTPFLPRVCLLDWWYYLYLLHPSAFKGGRWLYPSSFSVPRKRLRLCSAPLPLPLNEAQREKGQSPCVCLIDYKIESGNNHTPPTIICVLYTADKCLSLSVVKNQVLCETPVVWQWKLNKCQHLTLNLRYLQDEPLWCLSDIWRDLHLKILHQEVYIVDSAYKWHMCYTCNYGIGFMIMLSTFSTSIVDATLFLAVSLFLTYVGHYLNQQSFHSNYLFLDSSYKCVSKPIFSEDVTFTPVWCNVDLAHYYYKQTSLKMWDWRWGLSTN